MLKVFSEDDCGNAPKKQILKDFNIAFAKCDVQSIIAQVTDDIVWIMVGDKQIQGKEQFTKELEALGSDQAVELHIHHIITHGKTGAVNGMLKFGQDQCYAFCDIYVFNSSTKNERIKEIKSYVKKIS